MRGSEGVTHPPWPWLLESPRRPWCIAHRGSSARAFDNSLEAFDLASAAGADFWEVDVRTTSDGHLVAFHDATLKKLGLPAVRIAKISCKDFLEACAGVGQPMPRLVDVIEQALAVGAGLYIDAKDRHALSAAPALMSRLGVERGIVTSFNGQGLCELAISDCPYPRSILVRRGDDPITCALQARAQLIHLCWEWANISAIELNDSGLLEEAASNDLLMVLWHEERPEVLVDMLPLCIRGICTNQPELFESMRS